MHPLVTLSALALANAQSATVTVEAGGTVNIAGSGVLQVGSLTGPQEGSDLPHAWVKGPTGGVYGGSAGNYIEQGEMTNWTSGEASLPSFFFADASDRHNHLSTTGVKAGNRVMQGSMRLVESPVLFGRASLELIQECTAERLADRAAAGKIGCGTHTITHSYTDTRRAARVQAPSQPGDTWEFRAWCTTGPGMEASNGSLYVFACNDLGETPNQHPQGTSGWNGTQNGATWWIQAVAFKCDSEWRQHRVRYTMPYKSTANGAPDPTGWVSREWDLNQWSGVQLRIDHRGPADEAAVGTIGNPIFWDGFELRHLYKSPESCCPYETWNAPGRETKANEEFCPASC